MAITTVDGLVAAYAGSQTAYPLIKGPYTPQAIGAVTSMWTLAGQPGAGAAPSSGVAGDIPVDSTAGALTFTNPTAPVLSYLGRFAASSTQISVIYLYDRLWQNSGLSVTSTAGQTVQASTPTVPLTRPDANGAGVEAWWQIYTVMGAGTPTITITYTDQDGNTGNTGTLMNFAATAAVARTFQFALAAGDTGVRSIQTYTASATMLTGAMGLVLRRLIAQLAVGTQNVGMMVDGIAAGLPRIYDDAALELLSLSTNTSTTTITGGNCSIIQG